jgi:hypothetical protein
MLEFSKEVRISNKNLDYRVERFGSINEFNKYLEKEPNHVFKSKGILASREGSYSFTNTHTYSEAHDLLKYGWEDKAKEITKKMKNKMLLNGTRNKMVYDIVGFQPSVARYVQGIPQNMHNSKKVQTKKNKILNVVKFVTYPASISAERIEEESMKALRIIQLLENDGYKCNLFVNDTSWEDGIALSVELKIKNSADRLNISKVIFPLVHPSYLRRIVFAWVERAKHTTQGFKYGYGKAVYKKDDTENLINDLKGMPQYKNTLFIPSILEMDEEEYIKKELAKLK